MQSGGLVMEVMEEAGSACSMQVEMGSGGFWQKQARQVNGAET